MPPRVVGKIDSIRFREPVPLAEDARRKLLVRLDPSLRGQAISFSPPNRLTPAAAVKDGAALMAENPWWFVPEQDRLELSGTRGNLYVRWTPKEPGVPHLVTFTVTGRGADPIVYSFAHGPEVAPLEGFMQQGTQENILGVGRQTLGIVVTPGNQPWGVLLRTKTANAIWRLHFAEVTVVK